MRMLDHATGMESRRIHERIISVRDAIAGMSDSRVTTDLCDRIADMTGTHLRSSWPTWDTGGHALDGAQ